MRKLGCYVLVASLFSVATGFGQTTAQPSNTAPKAAIEEEATVAAAPAPSNVGLDLAMALDGDLDFSTKDKQYNGHFYFQVNYLPAKDWKLGIRNRFAYNYFAEINKNKNTFDWIQLRLFAEKKNFLNMGLIGTKYTLRVEPTTISDNFMVKKHPVTGQEINEFAGRYVKVTQRFDFTMPFSMTSGLRLRDEPVLELHAMADSPKKASKSLIYNRIELTPFVVLGPVYLEATLATFQKMAQNHNFSNGMFGAGYVAYNFTSQMALGFWVETQKEFSKLNTLAWKDLDFDLELSVKL
jgi:hypothetical protein